MDARESDKQRGKPVVDLVHIPLCVKDLENVTFIGATLQEPLKGNLTKFLQKNSDGFACTVADMPGIDLELITHKLNMDPNQK